MKTFLALMLISTSAMAGECCTGTCWMDGCCEDRQRCRPGDFALTYECVNVNNSTDKIRVKKDFGKFYELMKKRTTTSSGI